jgi:hypothetical protein
VFGRALIAQRQAQRASIHANLRFAHCYFVARLPKLEGAADSSALSPAWKVGHCFESAVEPAAKSLTRASVRYASFLCRRQHKKFSRHKLFRPKKRALGPKWFGNPHRSFRPKKDKQSQILHRLRSACIAKSWSPWRREQGHHFACIRYTTCTCMARDRAKVVSHSLAHVRKLGEQGHHWRLWWRPW